MKDRYKFRYWHTEKNQYICTQCDCLAICHSCLQSIRDVPDIRGWYNTVLDKAYNDFELIPEQCMGFKDKNDTLIYENDYLKDKFGTIWVVMWRGMGFVLIDTDDTQPDKTIITQELLNTEEFQIIGNIHEQAEQKDVK